MPRAGETLARRAARALLAAFAVFAAIAPGLPAQAQRTDCAPWEQALGFYEAQGKKPVAQGTLMNGVMIVLFTDERGTFEILSVGPGDNELVACSITRGAAWGPAHLVTPEQKR